MIAATKRNLNFIGEFVSLTTQLLAEFYLKGKDVCISRGNLRWKELRFDVIRICMRRTLFALIQVMLWSLVCGCQHYSGRAIQSLPNEHVSINGAAQLGGGITTFRGAKRALLPDEPEIGLIHLLIAPREFSKRFYISGSSSTENPNSITFESYTHTNLTAKLHYDTESHEVTFGTNRFDLNAGNFLFATTDEGGRLMLEQIKHTDFRQLDRRQALKVFKKVLSKKVLSKNRVRELHQTPK
jgi:hypothetical protein